jgi:hypothetical protein
MVKETLENLAAEERHLIYKLLRPAAASVLQTFAT